MKVIDENVNKDNKKRKEKNPVIIDDGNRDMSKPVRGLPKI